MLERSAGLESISEIVALYNKLLEGTPFITPSQHEDSYSSFHLYVIRIKDSKMYRHREVFERLRASGILVNLHYIPVYHHPYYQKMGYQQTDFPQAELYYSEAISLPIYFGLSDDDVKEVVNKLLTPLHHQTIF